MRLVVSHPDLLSSSGTSRPRSAATSSAVVWSTPSGLIPSRGFPELARTASPAPMPAGPSIIRQLSRLVCPPGLNAKSARLGRLACPLVLNAEHPVLGLVMPAVGDFVPLNGDRNPRSIYPFAARSRSLDQCQLPQPTAERRGQEDPTRGARSADQSGVMLGRALLAL
jgi:hypothetical protein